MASVTALLQHGAKLTIVNKAGTTTRDCVEQLGVTLPKTVVSTPFQYETRMSKLEALLSEYRKDTQTKPHSKSNDENVLFLERGVQCSTNEASPEHILQIEALKTQVEEKNDLIQALEDNSKLHEEVQIRQKKENQDLKAKLHEILQKFETFAKSKAEIDLENKSLKEELKLLTSKYSSLETTLENQNNKLQSLQLELNTNSELNSQIPTLTQKISLLENEKETLQLELSTKNREFQQQSLQVETLKQNLEAKDIEMKSIEKDSLQKQQENAQIILDFQKKLEESESKYQITVTSKMIKK